MKDTNLKGNRMVFSRSSKENVKLKPRPDPNTSWPWSVDNPKPDSEGGEAD